MRDSFTEQIGGLETQDTARTARHALTAGQTMALVNRLAQPGMPPDVDVDGAKEGADPALHAASCFRDYLGGYESGLASSIAAKQIFEGHTARHLYG